MTVRKIIATGIALAVGTLNAAQAKPHDTMKRIDRDQLRCLALNIYHEARGEPEAGKVAVAHVVMNRVKSRRFPNSVCTVVTQGGEKRRYRCQFSWHCDGRPDRPKNRRAWRKSQRLAEKVLSGQVEDRTQGALWYHAEYVSPYWRAAFNKGPKIGQHIFYNDRKATPRVASAGPKPATGDKRSSQTRERTEANRRGSRLGAFVDVFRAPSSEARITPAAKMAALAKKFDQGSNKVAWAVVDSNGCAKWIPISADDRFAPAAMDTVIQRSVHSAGVSSGWVISTSSEIGLRGAETSSRAARGPALPAPRIRFAPHRRATSLGSHNGRTGRRVDIPPKRRALFV
jgi:hypothetical protein